MAKKRSLSKVVMYLFVKSASVSETFIDFTYHPYQYVYKNLAEEMHFREGSIKSTLSRLEKRNLIQKQEAKNGEILIRLTSDGELLLLKERLKSASFKDKKAGYVLVIFDIPESSRKIRRVLRLTLKEFGFSMWQKSVWASRRDFFELLRKYLTLVGLNDYVILIESYKVALGKKS